MTLLVTLRCNPSQVKEYTCLIKSKHLSCHLPSIVQGDAHPVVDLRSIVSILAAPFGRQCRPSIIEKVERT